MKTCNKSSLAQVNETVILDDNYWSPGFDHDAEMLSSLSIEFILIVIVVFSMNGSKLTRNPQATSAKVFSSFEIMGRGSIVAEAMTA
jgi:hypothetical protein